MTSANFLWFLRDFVPEYHHAKFGCNWTTNKGETSYMVPKDPSLNRDNAIASPQKCRHAWTHIHISNRSQLSMKIKYALSISSNRKKNTDMSGLDCSFKQSTACLSPEWSFHANLQIILGNVNVSSCLKAAVPNPIFFF